MTEYSIIVIAEIGSVHDGSIGNALCLIDAAANAGANAVKFQTHIAEAETLRNAPMPPYFKGEPRFDYFQRTGFSLEQWRLLAERCREKQMAFVSSPFSEAAVDLLESAKVDVYKIPSGEVTNLPLLSKVAATGKPIILSSGMSSWDELDAAVKALDGVADLTLLQCTTEYPCPPERVGLNVMAELRRRYKRPVGFSDHTLGSAAALAAASLGASVIEKHFTFSRLMYGSDAKHSMEPREFAEMAVQIRQIETMLANPVNKSDASRFRELKLIFEKSIVSLRPIAANAEITADMVAMKKPGSGLPARRLPDLLGSRAACDIPVDHIIAEHEITWKKRP